ncbi:hypothetical protein GCM10022237_29790 [Nocardioides ginsengisoli]|uniref:AbiEi antitoxin C-terminal domain-containing protein n=1 Tax=Nocardioides ginsengisoli TaxID=363868 RepID=A0ABW3VU26_9ACTN
MDVHQVSRRGVVLPVHLDATGRTGPTPGQARGGRWRGVAPGWYVPGEVDGAVLDQRIVEALAGVPSYAAVTGWASLARRDARWFKGLAADGRTVVDVPVALQTRGVRRRAGVELTEDWLFDDDIEVVDGLPVTRPERAVAFEVCRTRSLAPAVRMVDLACAADLTDLATLDTYTQRLIARPGVPRLRTALAWADENVWSPQESTMRVVWRQRIPRALLANRPLFDHDGRHLVTPDLIDPLAGVVGEYDGAVHLGDGLRRRDLDRDALYRDLGLELVTMMSAGTGDVHHFERRLAAAYRRAARRPAESPRWTLRQPAWWVDTSTVARRRALTLDQRATWLRRLAL